MSGWDEIPEPQEEIFSKESITLDQFALLIEKLAQSVENVKNTTDVINTKQSKMQNASRILQSLENHRKLAKEQITMIREALTHSKIDINYSEIKDVLKYKKLKKEFWNQKKKFEAIPSTSLSESFLLNHLTGISKGDPPSARYGHSSCLVDDKIIIFGGTKDGLSSLDDLYVFDITDKIWNRIDAEDHPEARVDHCAVSYKNYMIVWGGRESRYPKEYDVKNMSCDLFYYNTKKCTWTRLFSESMDKTELRCRSLHSMCIVADYMLVFGGVDGFHYCDTLLGFHLKKRKWRTFTTDDNTPSPRIGHSCTTFDSKMFIFGGFAQSSMQDGSHLLNDLYSFSLKDEKWRKIIIGETVPQPRAFATLITKDEKFYLFGGLKKPSNEEDEFCEFHLQSNDWSLVPLTRQEISRNSHSSIVYKNEMFVFGGRRNALDLLCNDCFYVYDFVTNHWKRIL